MSILVLGLGNSVMSDDGLGSRAAAFLGERYPLRPGVEILDGGTLGLDLLPRLEGIEKLLIVDAIDMGAPPGTVFRLEGEEVPRAFATKLSVHQMGIQDLLAVAELQGHLPAKLVALGIQPESIEMGLELSPAVEAVFPEVITAVEQELARWGVCLS